MLQYEYARSAFKIGLELEKKLGVNSYKFGMIGSTESHTGLTTAGEDNFFGKHSGVEPGPKRWEHPMAQVGDKKYEGWSMVASGYAAVWAKENTRAAIFDAMMRNETYATTGPRMIVRFFGGWNFTDEDAQSRLPAFAGYTIGVPELITVWKDPDFDPSLRAFYYARVIEILTPRWTVYDAMRYGVAMPPEVPMITQERAYTSTDLVYAGMINEPPFGRTSC